MEKKLPKIDTNANDSVWMCDNIYISSEKTWDLFAKLFFKEKNHRKINGMALILVASFLAGHTSLSYVVFL